MDGTVLYRNEQDGKKTLFTKFHCNVLSDFSMAGNNGETYDNVPKGKRQLGQVTIY